MSVSRKALLLTSVCFFISLSAGATSGHSCNQGELKKRVKTYKEILKALEDSYRADIKKMGCDESSSDKKSCNNLELRERGVAYQKELKEAKDFIVKENSDFGCSKEMVDELLSKN